MGRAQAIEPIATAYAAMPRETGPPRRLDVSNPLTAHLLGPEWYGPEANHRWMPRRASLRMGGPTAPGQKLYLQGNCSAEQLRAGPILVTVTINGSALDPAGIHPQNNAFDLPDLVHLLIRYVFLCIHYILCDVITVCVQHVRDQVEDRNDLISPGQIIFATVGYMTGAQQAYSRSAENTRTGRPRRRGGVHVAATADPGRRPSGEASRD